VIHTFNNQAISMEITINVRQRNKKSLLQSFMLLARSEGRAESENSDRDVGMANVSCRLLFGDLHLRRVDVEDDLEYSREDNSFPWLSTEELWPVRRTEGLWRLNEES